MNEKMMELLSTRYSTEDNKLLLEDANEIPLEEALEELFQGYEHCIDLEWVFDTPYCDIYVLFVSWIENGRLETYHDTIERY